MSKNDSFIRWQSVTIAQLGFTTNLVFTIVLAIIGFSFKIIANPKFELICGEKVFFTFGFIFLIFSFISGIIINLTRLYDYRITAQIARKREKKPKDPDFVYLRSKAENLGRATWILLWIQLSSFGIGSIFIISVLLYHFSDKFF